MFQSQGEIVYRFPSACVIPLLLAVAQAAGCGSSGGTPATAKANGQVTLNGQPVTEGEIYFVAAEKGYSASSALDADGKYKIASGLPPASYKVFFAASKIVTPPKPGQPPAATKPPALPSRYYSETTSGQTAEVKAGDNQLDFKLE